MRKAKPGFSLMQNIAYFTQKIYWDAKNEMQCVPGTHKIDRTLRCKINFWWQKFCLGLLIQKWRGPWDSSWKFPLKTLLNIKTVINYAQSFRLWNKNDLTQKSIIQNNSFWQFTCAQFSHDIRWLVLYFWN